MPERHLHLNIVSALWLYVLLFLVLHPLVKYLLTRWHVAGVSDLAVAT